MKSIVLNEPDLVGSWVLQQTGGIWVPGRGQAFGLIEDDELIAGVIFDSWNGASLQMHVAAAPGAGWLNRGFLWICFDYPFNQLRARKLLGSVGGGNTVAQRFDEHLGFVREATLKDAHPDGSLIIYSMTREQCRWLTRPKRMPYVQAFPRSGA